VSDPEQLFRAIPNCIYGKWNAQGEERFNLFSDVCEAKKKPSQKIERATQGRHQAGDPR
jgi:hypothetical protein